MQKQSSIVSISCVSGQFNISLNFLSVTLKAAEDREPNNKAPKSDLQSSSFTAYLLTFSIMATFLGRVENKNVCGGVIGGMLIRPQLDMSLPMQQRLSAL